MLHNSPRKNWPLAAAFLAIASAGSTAHAVNYIVPTRTLFPSNFSRPTATYDDYNGDGVPDFIGQYFDPFGVAHVRIVSGLDGSTIRQYNQPAGGASNFGFRTLTLPDSTGDGRREILIGDNTDAWVLPSSGPGGAVDAIPNVFSVHGLSFGLFAATSNTSLMLASGDQSNLVLLNPKTGAVQARISNNVSYGYAVGSLGDSAINVGDINGDGIPDFASSGGNVNNGSGGYGVVYIISGATTTSGPNPVPIASLPAGDIIAQLTGTQFIGSGDAGGWRNTTVNLGILPPNGPNTRLLMVSGGPMGTNTLGGITADVLTRNSNGAITVSQVASYMPNDNSGGPMYYGEELVNVGDVNNDGVNDLAVEREYYVGGVDVGRIEIISGAGLLLGQINILQTITGSAGAYLNGSLQALGPSPFDGHFEFACAVQYNGLDNIYGTAIQVYETTVPEPASLALLAVAATTLLTRRRKSA